MVEPVEEPEDEEIVRRRVVALNYSIVETLLENPDEDVIVTFNLFEDLTVWAETKRLERWSASEYSWFGDFVERPGGLVLEIDDREQVIFTTIRVFGRPFRIEHLEGNQYEIAELDLSGLREEPPLRPDESVDSSGSLGPGEEPSTFGTGHTLRSRESFERETFENETEDLEPGAKSGHTDGPIIDVGVLILEEVWQDAGLTTIRQHVRNAVNETNQSFEDSNVNLRVRLVDTHLATWDGSSDPSASDYLSALRDAVNGDDAGLRDWKDDFGIDVVGLVTPGGGCGLGYLQENVSTNFSDSAYFVVQQGNCLESNLTFTHELGHVMGARHDPAEEKTEVGDNDPYVYNHGHVIASGDVRTIMAYADDEVCDDNPCSRIARWSDPDSAWTNGDALGVSGTSNNRRVLNNTNGTTAGFETPAPIAYGTVTDLITGNGLEDVLLTGKDYGPATDEDGFYDVVVREGGSALLRPEKGDYEFEPDQVSLSITSDTEQNFDAGIYHTISGRVSALDGLDPSAIELKGAPGSSTVTTDQFGRYEFEVLQDWSGTITPQEGDGHEFNPSERTYSSVSFDRTEENYELSLKRYAVEGQIVEEGTSEGVHGVTMEGLPYPFPPYAESGFNGGYKNNVPHGWSGTIRPVRAGYNFEPASRTYEEIDGPIEDDYTAIPSAVADSKWPLVGADLSNSAQTPVHTMGKWTQWSVSTNGQVTAPVIGKGGTIYVASDDGTVHAFNDDGSTDWVRPMGKGVELPAPLAAASGRLVYVPTIGASGKGRLYKLEDEGSVHSYFSTGAAIHTAPALAPSNTVYVGSDDGNLYALDGRAALYEKWSFDTGDMVRSSPAVDADETIYVGSDDGSLYAIDAEGQKLWSFDTGDKVRSAPAVDPDQGANGTVYVGSDDGNFYAVDRSTGQEKWRISTGGKVRSSAAIDSEGNVYFGSNDRFIYAVDASGQELGSYETGGAVTASPAISENDGGNEVLYVGADEDRMYAFDVPSALSTPRWDISPPGPDEAITSVALGENGLYFGQGDELVALGGDADSDGGRTNLQVINAGMVPSPEELYIALQIHDLISPDDPFGAPGWEDPEGCEGGPLIIPDCGAGPYGTGSPFREVIPEEELRVIGLDGSRLPSPDDPAFDELAAEAVVGEMTATFEAGANYVAVLAGFTNPGESPSNPDGRETGLKLFVKEGASPKSEDPERVQVMVGHFVPDAPEMEVTLTSREENIGRLKYGDMTDYVTLPPDQHEIEIAMDGSGLEPVRTKSEHRITRTYRLDLTDHAGETVSLMASGALQASEQPTMDLRGVTSDGEIDIARPAPPSDVVVRADEERESVRLSWISPDEELAGFHVYRSTAPFARSADATRITDKPLTGEAASEMSYVDAAPAPGHRLYYRLTSIDAAGTEGRLSEAVSAFLEPQTVTASFTQPFGAEAGSGEAGNYRLVALPGAAHRPLSDVVPGEPNVDWKAFWDDGSERDFLVEFDGSEAFAFQSGTGFWLTHTDVWSMEEAFEAVKLGKDGMTTIDLHEGWNIISNPLGVDVDWSAVEAIHANEESETIALQPLWTFEGSFARADTFRSARTGSAYYFFNDNPEREVLRVPHPNASNEEAISDGLEAAKQTVAEERKNASEVTVSARIVEAEEEKESTVRMGLVEAREQASELVAPPSTFEPVSLRILPETISEETDRSALLMHDHRVSGEEGTTFDLQVVASDDAPVKITAESLSMEWGYEAVLLDPATGSTYDLTTTPSITLGEGRLEAGEGTTDLQVAIGSPSYVDQMEKRIVPEEVDITAYPNPARNQMTVEVALPEATDVRLAVYDALGRRVAILEDDRRSAGRHQTSVDMSRFASGAYFVQLYTDEETYTHRITIVR